MVAPTHIAIDSLDDLHDLEDRYRRPEGRLAGSRAPQVTNATLLDLQALARARRGTPGGQVVEYLRLAEAPVAMNRDDKRRSSHKRSKRARKRRHRRWLEPETDRDKHVKELNRLMRCELERAPEDDGEIAGTCAVIARYAVPILLNDFELDESHRVPLEQWVMAKIGDVLRCQAGINASIDAYLAWREQCLAAVEPMVDQQ